VQGHPAAVDVWARPVPDRLVDTRVLDPVETDRLAGLRDEANRRSYAAGHLLVRTALTHLLGHRPGLTFDWACSHCGAQHGPPVLLQDKGLHISLSRTPLLVAVAITRSGPVGVDVETVSSTDFDGFPRTALHPAERHDVEVQDQHERLRRRATSWARKEAVLKSLGVGLRTDPASVPTPPSGIPTRWDGFEESFTVLDLALPHPDVVGAVALLGATDGISVRDR
jgi:4'-phosphopantetheinyl transferase